MLIAIENMAKHSNGGRAGAVTMATEATAPCLYLIGRDAMGFIDMLPRSRLAFFLFFSLFRRFKMLSDAQSDAQSDAESVVVVVSLQIDAGLCHHFCANFDDGGDSETTETTNK